LEELFPESLPNKSLINATVSNLNVVYEETSEPENLPDLEVKLDANPTLKSFENKYLSKE
jgi:hypothetical protein